MTAVPYDDCGTGFPVIIRSYDKGNLRASKCPIWQAARATSAAPGYFASQRIGSRDFVDGGVGTNNPVEVVLEEAEDLWPGRPITLISIGTGSCAPRNARKPEQACISVTTETERAHLRVAKVFRKGILPAGSSYHRFQLDDNLGSDVSLLAWKKLQLIRDRTKIFLDRPEVQDAVKNAALALQGK